MANDYDPQVTSEMVRMANPHGVNLARGAAAAGGIATIEVDLDHLARVLDLKAVKPDGVMDAIEGAVRALRSELEAKEAMLANLNKPAPRRVESEPSRTLAYLSRRAQEEDDEAQAAITAEMVEMAGGPRQ